MSQRQRRWDELGPASEARESIIEEMLRLCKELEVWSGSDGNDPNSVWGRLTHNVLGVNTIGDRLWFQAMFRNNTNGLRVSFAS